MNKKLYQIAWHNKSKARDYIGRRTTSPELAEAWLDDAEKEYGNSDRDFWIEESGDNGKTWKRCERVRK